MKEVVSAQIKTIFSEQLNSYITIKSVDKTNYQCKTYINGKKVIVLDEGYKIIEYTPNGEHYNVRAFVNRDEEIIRYYFDIIWKKYIINHEIYYDDLYLDVLYDTPVANGFANYITLVDESELALALKQKEITKEMYELAYKTAEKLMNELNHHQNRFVERGTKDLTRSKILIRQKL